MLKSSSRRTFVAIDEKPSLFSDDGKFALSSNGKRHRLLPSKYPGQPLIDRLPFLKRAKAKGSMYYYFKSGLRGSEIFERLPEIDDDQFNWAYQIKLSELDGVSPPAIRRPFRCKVYFIGCETGPIKIGLSTDLGRRLASLQAGCPFPLMIMATLDGGRSDELAYHRQFAASRLHGEWFERTPAILAEIERLTTPNPRNIQP